MADIAIFDLDYTLTKRGTWGRFVIKSVRFKPWLWGPLLLASAWAQWRYKQGKIARIRVKQSMMRWSIAGKTHSEMELLAQKFADNELKTGLRPGAILALEAHRAKGDEIIIASAAVDIIVAAIAKGLGIKYWVATNMKWVDGRLLPSFASPNCYGAEKLKRVEQLLDENPGLKQSDTIITMYSDSYSDLEILRFSDKGVAINADRKLKEAAKDENFDVINW